MSRKTETGTSTVKIVLFLAGFLGYLIPIILPVMLTNISADLGVTTGAVGALIGMQGIAVAIASLFVGALSDRYGRQHLLTCFLLLNGIALMVMGQSPNLLTIYVTGICSAVAFSPLVFGALAYIGDHYAEKNRSALVGLVSGALYAGVTFGIPIAVWIMDAKALGWRGVLIFFGFVSIASSFLAWKILDPEPLQKAAAPSLLRDVIYRYLSFLRERHLVATLAVFLIIRLGVGMYYTYGPAYLVVARGFPASGFLWVYSIGAIFAFLASLFAARIIGKVGILRVVMASTVGLILSMVLIISYPTTENTIVFTIGAFCTLYMLSESMRMAALHIDAVSKVDSSGRGSFLGLINFLIHSGTAVGAFLGGGLIAYTSDYMGRAAQMLTAYTYIVITASILWLASTLVFIWFANDARYRAPSVA